MNIAVFGGSFDPPHIGHEEIIKEAVTKLDIERLFVVPTFLNPFKNSFHTPSKIRYRWLKELTKDYTKVEILSYEVDQNREVATIETIKYIINKYKPYKIYLIIGADNLINLTKWQNYQELQKLVEFVVAKRGEIDIPAYLKKLNISANISSTELREDIKKEYLPKSIADSIIEYYNKEKNG